MDSWSRAIGCTASCAALFATAAAGCVNGNLDEPWNLHERRHAYPSPQDLPPLEPASQDPTLAVAVPMGLEPQALALAARDSLVVGKGVSLVERSFVGGASKLATVSSFGSMRIGSGARVGSIYDLGDRALVVERGATIDGYIKTSVPAVVDGNDGPRLGLFDKLEPYVAEFRWDLAWPAGSHGDRDGAGPQDLEPGAYDHVRVRKSGRALVHSGSYYVRSFQLEDGAFLDVDNTEGPVYLWIAQSLRLAGTLVTLTRDGDFLIGYLGAAPPSIVSAVNATLVAPGTSLELPRSREPHRGSFFARAIVVDDGATVEHVPFVVVHPTEAFRPSFVCAQCGVIADEEFGECCATPSQEIGEARVSRDSCLMGCGATAPSETCNRACTVSAPESVSLISDAVSRCEARAELRHALCQEHWGYRGDTCDRLGHPRPRSACGEWP